MPVRIILITFPVQLTIDRAALNVSNFFSGNPVKCDQFETLLSLLLFFMVTIANSWAEKHSTISLIMHYMQGF